METANSALSILPQTKEQIEHFSNMLISEIQNGQVDPLELLKHQKSIEKVFEKIKDDLRKASIDVAEKYGKGKFGLHGANFEVKEMGVKYDYKHCNDKVWEKLEKDKKDRETFLKSLTTVITIVDEETGEAVTVYPPLKTSTTSVVVSL